MSVVFASSNIFHPIICDEKSKKGTRRERKEKRRNREKHNRKLQYIENYMKKNHLLFKNEFLEIHDRRHSHIRVGYIECICLKNGWLHPRQYLKIIHY